MTPKEKATELVKKMHNCGGYGFELEDAKQCALIAVDEIIDLMDKASSISGNFMRLTKNNSYQSIEDEYQYWLQVKQEIEKL
jgi:hypothetical protein